MPQLWQGLRAVWRFLLEVCGENDYERFRAKVLAHGGTPPTRQQFFLDRVEHKYTRPNRCC